MHWVAPSEKDNGNAALEKRLWDILDPAGGSGGIFVVWEKRAVAHPAEILVLAA